MLTLEEAKMIVYADSDCRPTRLGDVVRMADDGALCDVLCPDCEQETSVPVTGGYCENCGRWCLPCCMCDPFLVKCDWGGKRCPFYRFKPVPIEEE